MIIDTRFTIALALLVMVVTVLLLSRRLPAVRRWSEVGGRWIGALSPNLFAVTTFLAGAILLFSGATPDNAGRLGWLNDVLPLPLVEASAYFASIIGVGLIVL